jgi:streptomycin 6-kinase
MDTFIQKAKILRGEAGEHWAKGIPQVIAAYEQKWQITAGKPFSLSYNYAAPAKRKDGTDVVLKIGFPGDTEFLSEIAALKVFNGNAAVKLLEKDWSNAVILLERVLPGISVAHLHNTQKETEIASDVLLRLWKKTPFDTTDLIPLERWFEGFARHRKQFYQKQDPLPKDLFEKAQRLFATLLETTKNSMLIHGDFNHNNILSSQRDEWLVIDPKGIIGDPLYDTSVFLYNYLPNLSQREHVREVLQKRIAIFSKKLAADQKRIIHWGIAQSVLSVIWSLEDREAVWEEPLVVAQLLATL